MWGPGLAESDAVTFFAVPPVSWLPEDKKNEIFEFSRADSNTFPMLYITVGKVKMVRIKIVTLGEDTLKLFSINW